MLQLHFQQGQVISPYFGDKILMSIRNFMQKFYLSRHNFIDVIYSEFSTCKLLISEQVLFYKLLLYINTIVSEFLLSFHKFVTKLISLHNYEMVLKTELLLSIKLSFSLKMESFLYFLIPYIWSSFIVPGTKKIHISHTIWKKTLLLGE